MKDQAFASNREWNGRVADGRIEEIKELIVHADDFVFPWEPIQSDPGVIWIAKLAEYRRSSGIKLDRFRHQHRRGLHLETLIKEAGKAGGGSGTGEVIEPTHEVLAVE